MQEKGQNHWVAVHHWTVNTHSKINVQEKNNRIVYACVCECKKNQPCSNNEIALIKKARFISQYVNVNQSRLNMCVKRTIPFTIYHAPCIHTLNLHKYSNVVMCNVFSLYLFLFLSRSIHVSYAQFLLFCLCFYSWIITY